MEAVYMRTEHHSPEHLSGAPRREYDITAPERGQQPDRFGLRYREDGKVGYTGDVPGTLKFSDNLNLRPSAKKTVAPIARARTTSAYARAKASPTKMAHLARLRHVREREQRDNAYTKNAVTRKETSMYMQALQEKVKRQGQQRREMMSQPPSRSSKPGSRGQEAEAARIPPRDVRSAPARAQRPKRLPQPLATTMPKRATSAAGRARQSFHTRHQDRGFDILNPNNLSNSLSKNPTASAAPSTRNAYGDVNGRSMEHAYMAPRANVLTGREVRRKHEFTSTLLYEPEARRFAFRQCT